MKSRNTATAERAARGDDMEAQKLLDAAPFKSVAIKALKQAV